MHQASERLALGFRKNLSSHWMFCFLRDEPVTASKSDIFLISSWGSKLETFSLGRRQVGDDYDKYQLKIIVVPSRCIM
ncbi:hypothetical protein U9M48_031046 [Paspalum notatum var. saurae]|uniref:Uncharacterized protein n=1 Tax=Paspalum notatum var. saurae TaxID=547442 RepID=A0AAQ3U200_PASNO